jgi:ABC-type maltose transport system permease subunit
MLVPPMALVVPIFVLMDAISLMDKPISVILVSSLYPFGVFLSYIYYSTTIPKELYESARLDGCNDFRLFTKIALPLSWPFELFFVRIYGSENPGKVSLATITVATRAALQYDDLAKRFLNTFPSPVTVMGIHCVVLRLRVSC